MRYTVLMKNTLREISDAPARYLAMFIMLFLGAFVYIGLISIGPTLEATLVDYADQYEMADLTISAPLGLRDDDLARAATLSDVRDLSAVPGAAQLENNQGCVIYLEGLGNASFPKFKLISGRMPRQSDELVLSSQAKETYALGDILQLNNGGKDRPEPLAQHRFQVVGFVQSPQYLTETQFIKLTGLGKGEIDYYAWAPKAIFQSDTPATIYVRYRDTANLNSDDPRYRQRILRHQKEAETLFQEVPAQNLAADLSNASLAIAQGRNILSLQQTALNHSAHLLLEKETMLRQGQERLWRSHNESDQKQRTGMAALTEGERRLQATRRQLDEAKRQLAVGKEQLHAGRTAINQGQKESATAAAMLQKQQQVLTDKKQTLKAQQAYLPVRQAQLQSAEAQLTAARQTLQRNQSVWLEGATALQNGRRPLAEARAQLAAQEYWLRSQKQAAEQNRQLQTKTLQKRQQGLTTTSRRLAELDKKLADLQKSKAKENRHLQSANVDQIQSLQHSLQQSNQSLIALDQAWQSMSPSEQFGLVGLSNRWNKYQIAAQRQWTLASLQRYKEESTSRSNQLNAHTTAHEKVLLQAYQEATAQREQLQREMDQAASTPNIDSLVLSQAETAWHSDMQKLSIQEKTWQEKARSLESSRRQLEQAKATLNHREVLFRKNQSILSAAEKRLTDGAQQLQQASALWQDKAFELQQAKDRLANKVSIYRRQKANSTLKQSASAVLSRPGSNPCSYCNSKNKKQ